MGIAVGKILNGNFLHQADKCFTVCGNFKCQLIRLFFKLPAGKCLKRRKDNSLQDEIKKNQRQTG
jgi:hypothetical protein